ncbi:hypothetical protein F5X99DRAFT_425062 [Biscogniauxia marginata]|nr:hypothetical protein F5X99DRAFT_425062 [Biscogniauxia marginata]
MSSMRHLRLDPSERRPLLRSQTSSDERPTTSPATTIVEWQGIRILTDPNFLHAGDHVHLGPGVTARRKTNPAVDLDELPALDCVLLSHYHEDHFDQLLEKSLNRNFNIITTPHAKGCLTSKESKDNPFQAVHALDVFDSMMIYIDDEKHAHPGGHDRIPAVKITGMPGKHVPPGPLSVLNDLLQAVPPTNGWMLELGHTFKPPSGGQPESLDTGYRIYISGDTLFVDDDYSVFLSPLSDFKRKANEQGWAERVVYLNRGQQFRFKGGGNLDT